MTSPSPLTPHVARRPHWSTISTATSAPSSFVPSQMSQICLVGPAPMSHTPGWSNSCCVQSTHFMNLTPPAIVAIHAYQADCNCAGMNMK